MWKRFVVLLGCLAGAFILCGVWPSGVRTAAQEGGVSHIHVAVDLVQLNVAVTDHKGNYITGLRPEDFVITEDGIAEEIATFGEGNESAHALPHVIPPVGSPSPSIDKQQADSKLYPPAS